MPRGEQQSQISSAKRCKRVHVPEMIVIKVDAAFGSQQMKWSEFQVVEGLYGPTVASICFDEVCGKGCAFPNAIVKRSDFRILGLGLLQAGKGRLTCAACRSANRSVLAAQKFLGLGGPRHQFGVKTEPI